MYSLLCTFFAVFLKCQKQDLWERFSDFFFAFFPVKKIFFFSHKNWNLVHSVGKLFTRTVAKTKKSAKRQRSSEGATLLHG